MRKLTLVRNKTFVAGLAKMKVYIEDSCATDIVINNVSCRKLGDLCNGEIKTFEIENNAARVYVIADKLSKNYCNDFYELPEGEEDVVLVGQNRYNPANGNAFRFEKNSSADAKKNRKKGLIVGLIILVLSFAVGIFIGLAPTLFDKAAPKEFSNSGMTIRLTEDFAVIEDDVKFTLIYESRKVVLMVTKEDFTSFPDAVDMTLTEYGEAVLEVFELRDSTLKKEDGLTGFEYNATSDREYKYQCYIYKSEDAFWLLQFATVAENAEDYKDEITEWAKSVTFE